MYEVWYLLLAHEEHEKNVGSIFLLSDAHFGVFRCRHASPILVLGDSTW